MADAERRDRTVFDKVWDAHVVSGGKGRDLLWIDRHFVHEGSFHAFTQIRERGLSVSRPELSFGVADHYVPTRGRGAITIDPAIGGMIDQLRTNTAAHGVRLFGLDDPDQGIVHVVGPEQGLTLPGLTIVCGDSHTSTHGAFGAIAFGIGASEVAHVLATQTIWQRRPTSMRARIRGRLAPGVSAKDMALALISRIGADGARGAALEFAGDGVRALGMDGRMTLCNMAIEAGARCGIVAPDTTTLDYLRGRPAAPEGEAFEAAAEAWLELNSDVEAAFDREIELDADSIAPTLTWGTSPEDALPIDALLPDPASAADASQAAHIREALDYMGLKAGQLLSQVPIDRIFIGSCTNSRIEDLRAAARVLEGRKAQVPGLVSPGSSAVKRQAEAEGLAAIFVAAGLEWVESGCSMCVGMNGDLVASGERCASTTNRNFRGRQGPGARTHLMSPAMVAAAAVTGRLADVRLLLEGRE